MGPETYVSLDCSIINAPCASMCHGKKKKCCKKYKKKGKTNCKRCPRI